ncbi:alkyl/aryl-sulfatase [Dankookia sp. GCM10030260]|uniref:alkyl/aryl-sulfatase n=1 Tax=Dankookia sp. GCM10030260 TaxID=3273390 RepID=UPI00361125D2
MPSAAKPATAATAAANQAVLAELPFHDTADFAEAWRGHVAPLPDGVVRGTGGRLVWDLGEYRFLKAEQAPPEVNPSLWRLARLNMANGLFEVCPGIYQIRGLDLANMTIVEGARGIIVIDALTNAEAAATGLALYRAHRGERPVSALIYTHSHADHFGGAFGVASLDEVRGGRVPVIAPDGFMEELGAESVLAGIPMARRANFQFGGALHRGVRGQVDAGLGKRMGLAVSTLLPPTDLIVEAVESRTIDGIELVFQMAPQTEAPAEMHIWLPRHRVLNMAENTTRHLHNFIPLRGAQARDTRVWSNAIATSMALFGDQAEILVAQHHWPIWGQEKLLGYLGRQRDLYKHIHDQALRLAAHGLRPAEISERLRLPDSLAQDWACRGYYGTVSHNAKAVYQRYLSWYDGNPANLDPLPPSEAARKLVEYLGPLDAVIARAREDFVRGEYRWVAQLMNQLVFADPDNAAARELCADAHEQLGYQAESATWRNAYLLAAQELRGGTGGSRAVGFLRPDMLPALSTGVVFDWLGVRLKAEQAAGLRWRIDWHFTDRGEMVAQNLENATLTQRLGSTSAAPDTRVTTTRAAFDRLVAGSAGFEALLAEGAATVAGDATLPARLFALLDVFETIFPVVTPR